MNGHIMRYSPFRSWMRMDQDLDKLMESEWPKFGFGVFNATAMDMYEKDGQLVAEVTLPNFKKEEISVAVDNGVLDIIAQHQEKEEQKGDKKYYLRETADQYSRQIMLPDGADSSQIEVIFEGGILKITMPISKKSAARQIEIK